MLSGIGLLRRRSPRLVAALAGALVLTATSAGAHTGHWSSVTASTTGTNTYPDLSPQFTFGTPPPSVTSFDFAAGWKFAHAPTKGTEISPTPSNGEVIGSGAEYGSFTRLFCGIATQAATVFWEASMTGAPAGAVAHWRLHNVLDFDSHIWVIEQNDATDDYRLDVYHPTAQRCSSQPAGAYVDLDVSGVSGSGGRLNQTPSTAGCYPVTTWFYDTSGVRHDGTTVMMAVGGAFC